MEDIFLSITKLTNEFSKEYLIETVWYKLDAAKQNGEKSNGMDELSQRNDCWCKKPTQGNSEDCIWKRPHSLYSEFLESNPA